MNSKQSNPENLLLIRHIIAHVPCAICRRRFAARDVQILDRRGNVWAMSVKCRACGTDAILFAVMNEAKTKPVRTDLTPDEWPRFGNALPIQTDDVIRVHEFIQSYAGDFTDLLEEPLPNE